MVFNGNHESNQETRVAIQPNIGLDDSIRKSIVEILNITLANEAVLAMQTQGASWNVCGINFLRLHTLLDNQYKQLNDTTDKIAERTRMLGGFAIANLKEILNHTSLEEQPFEVLDIKSLLANHEESIRFLREVARKRSKEYKDEGTSQLLVSIFCQHEKMALMLRDFLEPSPTHSEIQASKI